MPDARISELPAATTPGDADLAPLVQSNGTSLETRRATLAQLRAAVLADRGAHVRDYGAKGDGVTDDAPAIQAAINDLKTKGGGTLQFGARTYRIASAVVVSGITIRLQGMGFTEGFGPGQGTWLRIDATGFVPFLFSGVLARGSAVRDIGVVQVHGATLNASWAPTAYDYVFRVEDCFGGVDFDNVFLANVNRGIYSRNSGRTDIRRLRGQVFTTGVEIDQCYDTPRLHNLHFWPFWSSDTNVVRWTQANGDALVFRRSDGVFIDQAFALGYRSMFRFASSAAGVTTKFYIGQAYTDFCQYGVLIEADGTDGQIANLTHQGEIFGSGGQPIAGGIGLQVAASNTRVQVGNLRIDTVQDNAIRLSGSGNRLDVFSLRCVGFNTRNTGAAAIQLVDSGAATPNSVYLGSPPLLESGNGGPLTNSGSNAILAKGAPAGRAARPGLSVGATDTGLFQPAVGTLAGAVGGTEVLRATSAGAVTLGGAPGSHALEVATPAATANRVLVSGAAAGAGVSIQAQGADASIDLTVSAKGSGLLRTASPQTTENSTAVATTAWVRGQGYLTAAAAAPVSSVAGRTGAITLEVGDVTGAAPLASPALTGTPTAPTPATADSSTALATTAFVKAQGYSTTAGGVTSVAGRTGVVTLAVADVAGAAPLASPALTGTPTAPTPATADNGTTLATTAFVKAQGYLTAAPVTSVAGRSGVVTLAVGDVAGAAPLASPALIGTPTVPTATPGTNTTQAASTAFVTAAVAAGGGGGGALNGSGTSDPTASTDSTAGYAINSQYFNTSSGMVWVCASATAGAAVWLPLSASEFFGYLPGNSYWLMPSPPTTGSTVAAADVLYLFPFMLRGRATLTALSGRVTAGGAGSAMKVGIWRNNGASRPTGTPVLSNNTGVATTSITGIGVPLAGTLPAGAYWCGAKFTGTLPGMAMVGATSWPTYLIGSSGSLNQSGVGAPGVSTPDSYANNIAATDLTSATFTQVTTAIIPQFAMLL